MIIRHRLLRQCRTLLQTPSCATDQSIRRAATTQARSLHIDNLHINLSPADRDKSLEQLWQEGILNDNVAQWLHRKQLNQKLDSIGAVAERGYQPHTLITQPPTVDQVTLELLLASQTHLGHATSLWHPGNARYIYGIREGVHIISLEATAAHLRRAAKVVHSVADQAGLILFAGTRKGQERAVVGAAKRAQGCHVFDRWIPGTLTNGTRILERCEKRVIDQKDRHLTGFEDQLTPMASLKPDLVVCLNPVENYVLLHECALYNIPTIGIVDTNCNPTWVTYPIPANDDSVQVIAGVLGRAAEAGRKERLDRAEARDEVVPVKPHTLVLPAEYDPDAGEDSTGEIIDLRDQSGSNTVRFANPRSAQQASSKAKPKAEDELKELYRQDQVRTNSRLSARSKSKRVNDWDIFGDTEEVDAIGTVPATPEKPS